MEYLKINGVEFAYEIIGTGEPAIFIHGSLISDTFRPMATGYGLDQSYQLILYRRRGYDGSSPLTRTASIASQAEDCRLLLLQLGIDMAHVVGHSYGGVIALQLTLDAPAVVQTLVLLEPALSVGDSGHGYREALIRATDRFDEADAATVVDEFLRARWPEYRESLDEALPGAFAQAVEDAATSFRQEFPALLDWRFAEGEAGRISQPVLSVLGEQSEALWPRFGETHRTLQAWLSNCEGAVIPGATHFLQTQHPAAVAAALSTFWQRHPFMSGTP